MDTASTPTKQSIKVVMNKAKETKGTVMYVEGAGQYDPSNKIGTQYIKKAALQAEFGRFPEAITITVTAA
jgi:hypothetical protein